MIKDYNIYCDECDKLLGYHTVEDGCGYAIFEMCFLKQQRNKLNREISTLKKATLKQ